MHSILLEQEFSLLKGQMQNSVVSCLKDGGLECKSQNTSCNVVNKDTNLFTASFIGGSPKQFTDIILNFYHQDSGSKSLLLSKCQMSVPENKQRNKRKIRQVLLQRLGQAERFRGELVWSTNSQSVLKAFSFSLFLFNKKVTQAQSWVS